MGLPAVQITKNPANTGNVTPSEKGICAIIAPCQKGTQNQPASYSKPSSALSDFGYGVLTDDAAYVMGVSGNPVLLVRATASTAAVYGAMTLTGTGTTTPSGTGAPLDDFNVVVTITLGGIVGTGPISYTYSLDGGVNTSAVQALGTATEIDIPNSGVAIALTHSSSQTLVTGDVITFTTTGPRMNNTDLTTALEALRTSALPWEIVLVGGLDATSTTITTLDTWLAAREAEGRFRGFVVGARPKGFGVPGETEAAYSTAMQTAFGSSASIRGCVCADVGDLASVLPGRGIVQQRSSALALAARLMKIDFGTDAAYVSDGPVPGFALADSRGNPNHHDENLYPGLDDLRLVTLRSFERKAGTFITNANVISTQGSDFVYAQHFRVMNRACEIAYDILTNQLSRGVHKNPKPGPGGAIYISEEDAQALEQLVNAALQELVGQVTALKFVLSRTDDIGANGPITLNGQVEIEALAYAKKFNINASFVRTISVQQ